MATSDNRKPTIKEQRAAKRAAQLEALKKQEAARKRNRILAIVGAIVALALVIGSVAAVFVGDYLAKNGPVEAQEVDDALVSGDYEDRLLTFGSAAEPLDATHVTGRVDYTAINPDGPPAGGPHNAAWLTCGVYEEPQTAENAVHSLEHGAVWFTYDPDVTTDAELAALRAVAPSSYAIVSPIRGLGEMMAVSAWGAQLRFLDADDPAVQRFLEDYWRSPNSPEPGAPCSGAYTGPGLVG